MRITCPACEATYDVPDAMIGTGRRLRCAKCSHAWTATPGPAPPDAALADPVAPPAAKPVPRPAVADGLPLPTPAAHRPPQVIDPPLRAPESDRASRRAAMVLAAAWVGSGLLLGALGIGAWVYRGPIMEAWPPAARVYLLLGATQDG